MHRRSLLSAALPVGLVTVTGCGDNKSFSGKESSKASVSASPSASATYSAPTRKIVEGPLPAITAGTRLGEKPTIAKGTGEPSNALAVKIVIAGGGRILAENDYIQANYLGQIWDTGKVFDNSYDRKTPLFIRLAQGAVIDGWHHALTGKKAGSRIEFSVPPTSGYGVQGNPRAGIKGTDTLVFVVDLQASFNSKSSAQGKTVAQSDTALPRVGTNTDGRAPSIAVSKAKAPKNLVANYVIEGDGPEVKANGTVLVQYKGVLWDTGKEFGSTYSKDTLMSFSLRQVVRGLARGLTGKKVGSRVLIVIPSHLGYGTNPPPSSPFKKDSTLVFSVDILGTA